MSDTEKTDNLHAAWKAQECGPKEMAEWIVSGWRESHGSDRVLIIAITEALKVIPAAVGDLEAEIAELRKGIETLARHRPGCLLVEPSGCTCGLYDLWRGLCRSCHGAVGKDHRLLRLHAPLYRARAQGSVHVGTGVPGRVLRLCQAGGRLAMCPHVWEYDETNHRRCVTCDRRETPCPIGFCEDWRPLGGAPYCAAHGGDHGIE